MRMCGGALKGLPLRELVENLFEGIACRPFVAGSDGGFGGAGGKSIGGAAGGVGGGGANAELTALAVMHLPDLLQCFSEVCACAVVLHPSTATPRESSVRLALLRFVYHAQEVICAVSPLDISR